MKFRWDKKYLYWGVTAFLVIVLSILLFSALNRFDVLMDGVSFIIGLLMPFIVGFVFAYLLDPVVAFFEKKCLTPLFKKRKKQKPTNAPRAIAIIISLVLVLGLITGLLFMVLPQLGTTLVSIISNLPQYASDLGDWVLNLVSSNEDISNFMTGIFQDINTSISNWVRDFLPQLNKVLGDLTEGIKSTVSTVMNLLIGLIVAIYALFSKEKFLAQSKKVLYSLFSVKTSNLLLRVARRADSTFGGFIKGKLIDSMLIGVLCFIGMTIFQMPFSLVISVLIGVSNIIPFFGPFIGAVPAALLILLVDPFKCLGFIIFIVVLQQFDGNVLGPRILGGSTGLSAFWVTFAIVVFGGLFGFVGMIIGVPTFALLYAIISEAIENKLARRRLPSKTGAYYDLDYIDEDVEEPVYREDTDDVKEARFDNSHKRILKPVDNTADTKLYQPEKNIGSPGHTSTRIYRPKKNPEQDKKD